jgi:hypothetical protein
MPAAAAISSPATASNVCSASAVPAPVSSPAPISTGRAQQAAHASTARAALTLLRSGGPPPSVMCSPGSLPRAVRGTVTGPVDARWS